MPLSHQWNKVFSSRLCLVTETAYYCIFTLRERYVWLGLPWATI